MAVDAALAELDAAHEAVIRELGSLTAEMFR